MELERVARAALVMQDWRARAAAGDDLSSADLLQEHRDLADLLAPLLAADAPPFPIPSPRATISPRDGERFGEFVIEQALGVGGMGRVYLAYEPALARHVALKLILHERLGSERARERFNREARAAARLRHPGICEIYSFGDQPVPWIAMRYVPGETLRRRLERGPERALPWREACRLVVAIAAALHHAHATGIVHRDLKPDNVMVDANGEPVLIDFGVARIDDAETLTRTDEQPGTPSYMAPEQVDGRIGAVDARTDVFALGAVLHELLTGQMLFAKRATQPIAQDILDRHPQPPTAIVQTLPAALDLVVQKATAKHPDDRYASTAALATDLERVLAAAPVAAQPLGRVMRVRRWCQRHPLPARLIAALAMGSIVLLLLVWGFAVARNEALAQTQVIEEQRQSIATMTADAMLSAAHGLAETGNFDAAEQRYLAAGELGADAVEVQLGLADVHDARCEYESHWQVIDQLANRPDLGRRQARLTLLRCDPTRALSSRARQTWRADLQSALQSGDLDPSRAAYVRALLAEDLNVVRSELATALRENSRNRAANEMLVTLVLVMDGVEPGRVAAREFARLYPDHSAPRLVEAFCLLLQGREDEARAVPGVPADAFPSLDAWAQLIGMYQRWGRTLAKSLVDVGLHDEVDGNPLKRFALELLGRVSTLNREGSKTPLPLRWAPRLEAMLSTSQKLLFAVNFGTITAAEAEPRIAAVLRELQLPLIAMLGAQMASNEQRYMQITPWFQSATGARGLFAIPRDAAICWLFHMAHDRHQRTIQKQALDAGEAETIRRLVDDWILPQPCSERELAFTSRMLAMARLPDLAQSVAFRLQDLHPGSGEIPYLRAWTALYADNLDRCAAFLAELPVVDPPLKRRVALEAALSWARQLAKKPR